MHFCSFVPALPGFSPPFCIDLVLGPSSFLFHILCFFFFDIALKRVAGNNPTVVAKPLCIVSSFFLLVVKARMFEFTFPRTVDRELSSPPSHGKPPSHP